MWSQLLLCCLVGFAAASEYGWQNNKEYVYKVHGRTLTGLHEVADQYSGIVLKATLIVRPETESLLMARIVDAKYSQVHTQLPEGWKSKIPEHELHYEELQLSEEPIEIHLKKGIVVEVIVSKDVRNWDANIIKSFISQIQFDTQSENVIESHINQLPEEDSNNAVFNTMEETVTGKYETTYDMAPLPEYVLQSQPWLVPMPELKGHGEFIEVVKSKNFSRAEERLGYYYGLGGMGDFEPNTNKMGDFFLRSSVSRAVLSGSLKKYTIQSCTTTNKIIISPTLNNEQKGIVVSHLNLTLSNVKQAPGSFEKPQQSKKLGSLTYSFDTPFSTSDNVYSQQQKQQHMYASEGRQHYRNRRSYDSKSESESVESNEDWTQEQPKLSYPPQSPLLPLYVGYMGKSVKNSDKVDIVQTAQKLAQEIGKEIQHAENIPKEQSLAKFIILGSVARIMTEKEIEQAAGKLYTTQTQGSEAAAWSAYRDAIAECGTGPAFLNIKEWIKNKKITGEEAAEVISTMAESVRQPTEEYMRAFYQLVTKNDEIKHQAILNDTAILSYSTLVRKVYVDKLVSHNQFPVHSFGKFNTASGLEFVSQEYIPYLKQKLEQAIQNADSHKVLVYIRALGNVAHQKVLAVFEPYLEGDKQCSQFQRLQMVVALNKLVKVHPKIARSVMYKIYQNSGEEQEIRAAAVYQLLRTNPPASMLQRMAQYTNVDTAEQVNAAVKSAIESAAELEGAEFAELVENALAAVPLLTKTNYGLQYSRDSLCSYVQKEMQLFHKQTIQIYGSQDSIFPKGLKYALRTSLGGIKRQLINVQGMVSSIDELTNVFARQTEQHQKHQQQQEQNYQQAEGNQFSSENIAKLLNIKTEEREQLEANLIYQIGGGVTRFFTINNRTIELLPEVVREIEELLRGGQEISYTKLYNRYEMVISFPTEMALPFIYTLDAPTLLNIQGQIRATAEPKVCSGSYIRTPHTITAQSEISTVISSRIQAKLGFITPFDHQQYTSGYDKNLQVNLPIATKIEIDLNNKQMQAQVQAIKPEQNREIIHYSSWPYTAKHDILNLEPISNKQSCKIIYKEEEQQSQFESVIGKKSGMAFRVEYVSDQKFLDTRWLYEQLRSDDIVTSIIAPFYDESMQYTKLRVHYAADESSSRTVSFRLGLGKQYVHESHEETVEISQFNQLPRESKARQQQFAKMAASGVSNADVYFWDAAVEFEGQSNVEYVATAAWAKSPVDKNARLLFNLQKHSQESKPYQISLVVKANTPNTNGLDFAYALKFNPTTTAQAELAFGEHYQTATKINLNAKLQKSDSRKMYLKNHPRAEECHEEMEQGNKQLPACANLTAEANLLDRVYLQVQYDNVSPIVHNYTQKLYSVARYLGYYNIDENTVNPQVNVKKNQIDIEARFEADFESVNVTLKTDKLSASFDQLRLNSYAKQVLAVHPAFPVYSRVMSEVLQYDPYWPMCIVDQSAVNTVDNKTYPIELGNAWTVMMQYVPDFARPESHFQQYHQQQKELQTEQYVVLVRDSKSGSSSKDVRMTVRSSQSKGKLIDVELKPIKDCSGSQPCAEVFVNQKQIECYEQKSISIENGFIQVYALPNGEVKIEVRDAYYVIYDGERVVLTPMHDKFRDAIRGLCGTFTGEESDDFLTPKNCILLSPYEFAATYAIEDHGRVQEYKSRAAKSPCYYKDTVYANVISERDAGRSQQFIQREQHHQNRNYQSERQGGSCTKHQTRYEVLEDEDQICFSIRPVPTCKSSCSASKVSQKSIPMHCVQSNNVSNLWKKQIQQGASPDFSRKSSNKNLRIEVPESCQRY